MPSPPEALRSPELLHRASSRLLIVDVQEKLVAALSDSTHGRLVSNCRFLIEGARLLGVPVTATEQYPQGLGPTVATLAELISELRFFIRHTGPAMSPFNAWVLSKSLETLSLRMERHCANALALATHFERHPSLDFVRYPYLASHPDHALAKKQMSAGGGIVVLELKGGIERARRFLDALELLSHTPNLGDTRSIVTHPTSTTQSKLREAERQQVGIVPGMVRVSVGLEHRDDIIADIEQALDRSA